MKAAVIHRFGNADELTIEERAIPNCTDGEILIDVCAIGINPIDFKTRRGQGVTHLWEKTGFPLVLGWDISGIVTKSHSIKFNAGDEVFGMSNFPQLANGYAEFVSGPAEHFALKPKTISHIEAAATPLAGLTAYQALFTSAELTANESVLIHAGAGGVGHMAIQLAKCKGANVITTTSSKNSRFVARLGADKVVDYNKINYWEVLSDIDVIFHTIPPELRIKSYQTIKPGGRLISITGPVPAEESVAHGIVGKFLSVRPNGVHLAELAALLTSGILKVNIDAYYSLENIAKAHLHLEEGHTRGKVVINLKS